MNFFNQLKVYPLLLLIAGLVSACDTTSVDLNDSGESTARITNPYAGPTASKLFLDDLNWPYQTATIKDSDSLSWTITFVEAIWDSVPNVTVFHYQVQKPEGSSGTHFAYRIPQCIAEPTDRFVEAYPVPGINANANGDLEWGPSDLGSLTDLYLSFENLADEDSVRWGVVQVGLKSPGSGNDPAQGEVIGPCRGRYTISGTVFLNEDFENDDLVEEQTGAEPGLANVEVTLEQKIGGVWVYDASAGIHLTSGESIENFGKYEFEVLLAPDSANGDGVIKGAPTGYRVRISRTAEGPDGINTALFNDAIFEPTCLRLNPQTCVNSYVMGDAIVKEVDLAANPMSAEVNFGFEVKVKHALDLFENETLWSDGFDRVYWYYNSIQKTSKQYPLDYTTAQFEYLLNCGGQRKSEEHPAVECIVNKQGTGAADFGGDVDDLIDSVFAFQGNLDDVAKAADILKGDNNGQPNLALLTQLLRTLLNFTVGRGLCEGGLNAGGDMCANWDEVGTRSIIQNALVVLYNTGFRAAAQKVSGGSVGTNTSLLGEM